MISVVAIGAEANEKDGKYVAISVLVGVFPLIAALIGGVLAYYASLSNFAMAANAFRNFAPPAAGSSDISVTLAMTETAKIVGKITLVRHRDTASVNLRKLLSDSFNSWVTRVPILNSKGIIEFVIHERTVSKFITKMALEPSPRLSPTMATLRDLLEDPELGHRPRAFVIVPSSFTLAEVKRRMDSEPACRDAFVTQHGRDDEPIIGWVTDTRLAEFARA
jgi:hypothetical protein